MPRLTADDICSRKVQSWVGMQWRSVASVNWPLLSELEADTVLLPLTSEHSSLLSLILQPYYWNRTRKCGRDKLPCRATWHDRVPFRTDHHFVLFFASAVVIMCTTCLGAVAKLGKATASFVMSVCPSVCMEQISSHWTVMKFDIWVLYEIWREDWSLIKIWQENGYLTCKSVYLCDNISPICSYSEKCFRQKL